MENFILYEELGAGAGSIIYKGRRKGTLNYVAVRCADKTMRPEITNHVQLSLELDHPNVVSFYEWYETSNHLWLVIELCTGGSLKSLIDHDGGLSEDVIRRFGWDLVKGLKYIHEVGIIFSDLNPSKILLDGSGILKLGNFGLSKAEGEAQEDLFTLLSASECGVEQDSKDDYSNMQKKLKGCPAYSAPEILQGSETSMSSDLWALGCILHYMYTGKPPFYSDSYTELNNMIIYQELPPPRQTVLSSGPPSEGFLNLLKSLLCKNPDERMGWTQLLDHSFWTEVRQEEECVEEEDEANIACDQEENSDCELVYSPSSRHSTIPDLHSPDKAGEHSNSHSAVPQPTKKLISLKTANATGHRPSDRKTDFRLATCGAIRDSKDLNLEIEEEELMIEDDPKLISGQQMCDTMQPNKSFTLDNISELRPKKGVNEDNTEAIFLLSTCANSRRSCCKTNSHNQSPASQASTGTDIKALVRSVLYTDSDLTVSPIMDNPKIYKVSLVRFDSKTLCVPVYTVEKLQSLSDEQWTKFLLQLCSVLTEKISNAPPPTSTAIRSRLNLLCYLCCVVGHKVVANRMINSELLPVLTQQLRHAPNWDMKSKVLRVMGLLALHCTELAEDSPVSEAVTTLSQMLRENLRNSTVKQFLLPPLGEFLYLIASQEEKRGSPEGLWFVPAAAYTGLMRSLREGDDSTIHHIAAKAIENIYTIDLGPSHPLKGPEIGSVLWNLFNNSTVEAVRVTAISSLSRLTRLVPTVFSGVIDTCGPAAILESLGGAGARVQQHLLTALVSALLTSRIQIHRITQSKDLVLKVLCCLESPSTVTRAKTLLLLHLLIHDNTQILLHCCQHRLVMYLERDLRKAHPLRENPGQSGYLSQCLDILTTYLISSATRLLDAVICALHSVIGRRHPSTAQSRQLKQTLPLMSVVLELVSSQVFRSRIVTEDFLGQIGLLMNCITSVESKETSLASVLGSAACEELMNTSLSIMEVLSQHHNLITSKYHIVVDTILPPLTTLAFSRNVELSMFALRVFSELSPVLMVQLSNGNEDKGTEVKVGREAERLAAQEGEDRSSSQQTLSLIIKSLLPRYESLLRAAEPIPLYALKLLLLLTEKSMQMCRLIKQSRIFATVLQVIMANSSHVNSGLIQNAVALLCNLSGVEPLCQQGLIDVVLSTLPEAAQVYLDGEENAGRKDSHLVLQALLELLHNILKHISTVVRSAFQSQRLSCPALEMEAAEKLLLENRPLSQLSTLLILMLSTENHDVWEESVQCLSLLVQLYGGEGHDCLSPSCLRNFSHALRSNMHDEKPEIQCTTLRIIKRLVQTTEQPDWSECPEGVELINLLKDITTTNRCHINVFPLAADVLQQISGS